MREARARLRPDGVLLTWQAAGLSLSLTEGWLPFFMQWDDPVFYPGRLPVQHAIQPQGIAWLEITPRDPLWLQRWLGNAQVPLRLIEGVPPGVHRVVYENEHPEIPFCLSWESDSLWLTQEEYKLLEKQLAALFEPFRQPQGRSDERPWITHFIAHAKAPTETKEKEGYEE